MIVRCATPDDFPALLALGALMVEEAKAGALADVTFDRSRLLASLHLLHENGVIFVAEQDGGPIGALLAMLEPGLAWAETCAVELGFFVQPGHRGVGVAGALVEALIEWAKARGAHAVSIGDGLGISSGAVFAVSQAHGFLHSGTAYKLKLR